MDNQKIMIKFVKFITGKHELLPYFTRDSIEKLDKQILLERMIENTIEDIVIFNELRSLSGEEMDEPLSLESQEEMKRRILNKLRD